MDPRLAVVERRLSGVGTIVAVAAAKGGVGKSTVAATLALAFAREGRSAGLLDLDLHGPSAHLILGIEARRPEEDHGILPLEAHGLKFLSLHCYTGDRPAPLRGQEISDAILELLAITRWGSLDVLLVDMPPGIGDATLDAIRLIPGARYLIVTTPSRVALGTVRRLVALLLELKAPIVGAVGNMWKAGDGAPEERLRELGLPILGALPLDEGLERALGTPAELVSTRLMAELRALLARSPALRPAPR